MQQLPPFPDNNPPEPSQPGQPSEPGRPTETPSETPPTGPDIDVPSPAQPSTVRPVVTKPTLMITARRMASTEPFVV
jgi:hypothetical protein